MNKPFSRSYRRVGWRLGVILAIAAICQSLSGCYLVNAATTQVSLILQAISVEKALASPHISDADKAKIRLIQDVRAFTESTIGLDKTDNYTTYVPGEKVPAMYVLTAAPKDSLDPYTWSYPVVGETTFKSFFDEAEAEKEQRELEAKGYDTWLRPADGYSTSGYLSDPILPIMLERDDVDLVQLIIHELSHSTLYRHEAAEFSESFAVFVQREGARQYLAARYGAGSREARMLEDRIADEERFDAFVRDAAARLRAFYASKPADVVTAREKVFDAIRGDYARLRPKFRTEAYRQSSFDRLNNARLNGYLTYSNAAPFAAAYRGFDRDWPAFIAACKTAVKDEYPFRRLQKLVGANK